MYTKYWKLKESPFLNVEDEHLCYPSEQYKEGLARLYYLIGQERTAGMLIGQYGVGKTYLLSRLAQRTEGLGLPIIRFDAIPDGSLQMARHILSGLGVKSDAPTMADALMRLQQHCMDSAQIPISRHILIIDEAQYLTEKDGLYLVHFLCNLRIETDSGKKPLFTIVLAGTHTLAQSVNEYESLKRRIQLSWELCPLTETQTIEYVQQRIREAGGDIRIFPHDSLVRIYKISGGIPRNINNLCDTALMLGYAAQSKTVTPQIVEQSRVDTGL